MPNQFEQISGLKIKQVFLILIITALLGLILYNLQLFVPSLLGAITLYIVFREFNLKLIETRNWKPWQSALLIILISLLIIVLPVYLIADLLIEKLANAQGFTEKINGIIEQAHNFILQKTNFDILSKQNLDKLKSNAGTYSTKLLSGTVNTLTILMSMYFILYFMLEKPRFFEQIVGEAMPLKRANINKIGEKFRKLVIANAVGIPVVALGQGIVAGIGYLIFGAPSPLLLFALTAVGSMLPIVGASIVYIPVSLFMLADGQTGAGIGLLAYSFICVGLTDNVLRFTLLKKLENIHPLNTVFGIIMGMNLFGFMGLIFGPIMVSMTVLLLQVYHDEFSSDDTPALEIPDDKPLEKKVELIV